MDLKACIASQGEDALKEAKEALNQFKGLHGLDLAKDVSTQNEFTWEEKQFTKQAGTKKDGTRDKGTELLIMNYKMNPLHEGESIKKINSYLTTDLKENKLIGEFFNNE